MAPQVALECAKGAQIMYIKLIDVAVHSVHYQSLFFTEL